MADAGSAAAPLPDASPQERARARWFRVVLVGLLLLVLGFTAILVRNSFYPCIPAEGSTVQPPLLDCAFTLSPWIGLAAVGVLIAGLGYLRVH